MYEHRADDSSAGRATQRLTENEQVIHPPTLPPRHDHTRILAFGLIGLGVAMFLSNLRELPWAQGDYRAYTFASDLKGANAARVHVEWGNGYLAMNTNSSDSIVSGSITGSGEIVPDVEYDGRFADVTIRDAATGWFGGRSSTGTLTLSEQPRYELLDLDLGSGASDLDLSSLDVRELNLDGGSGTILLHLPSRGSLRGEIELGSGAFNLTLPPDIAARIELDKGSGGFSAGDRLELVNGDPGDGVYETPGFEDAEQRIDLDIEGGSGSIVVN